MSLFAGNLADALLEGLLANFLVKIAVSGLHGEEELDIGNRSLESGLQTLAAGDLVPNESSSDRGNSGRQDSSNCLDDGGLNSGVGDDDFKSHGGLHKLSPRRTPPEAAPGAIEIPSRSWIEAADIAQRASVFPNGRKPDFLEQS